jgi:hypothetical protein
MIGIEKILNKYYLKIPELGIRYFLPFSLFANPLIRYFNVAIRYRYSATFQKFAIRYSLYAIRYTLFAIRYSLFATFFEQCNRLYISELFNFMQVCGSGLTSTWIRFLHWTFGDFKV